MTVQLLTPMQFLRRVLRHTGVSFLLTLLSLLIGAAGYHWTAGLGWMDSFLNATMILTGMGPLAILTSPGAKLFAMIFALYSGVYFVSISAIVVYPFAHRLLKHVHAQAARQTQDSP